MSRANDAYISFLRSLPDINEISRKTQLVYSVSGTSFCWITLNSTRIQIFPSLGKKENPTRVLRREGTAVLCVRIRTGAAEAKYIDPKEILKPSWSYPGFRADSVDFDYGASLIRQAYDQARSYKGRKGKSQLPLDDKAQRHTTAKLEGFSTVNSPSQTGDQISRRGEPKINNSERVRSIFRKMEDIINSIEPREGMVDLASRISRLSREEVIPNEIASLMHSIRIKRNEVEHDRYEPSPRVMEGIEAYWQEIQEWWVRNK